MCEAYFVCFDPTRTRLPTSTLNPEFFPYETQFAQITVVARHRTLAVALTGFLFVVGSLPAAGQAFAGPIDWLVHLASYAAITFAYTLGWQSQSATLVTGFVAALGGIHECSEILTHNHGLEIADILVNSIGAPTGVVYLSGH